MNRLLKIYNKKPDTEKQCLAFLLGSPIGESHLRDQMQKVIDEQGLPDVVFHVFFFFGNTNIGKKK